MNKIFLSMLALVMAAFTFTGCDDVPEPYDEPGEGGNGGGTVEGEYLNETFSKDFGRFELKNVKGTPWTIDYNTAKATGYDNTTKETTESESYLVSPEVDLTTSTGAYLQFEYIYMYKRTGAENKVYITDNYSGDPTTTTWDDITGELTVGSDWQTFTTYQYNLDSKYIGKKIRIALYYSCGTQSSTIEVKNLVLKEGKVDIPDKPGTETDVLKPTNGVFINESFASDFGVFEAKTVKGTAWTIDFSTAKATGYDNGTKTTTPSEAYLVSKPMDMTSTKSATVSFEYILRYYTNYGEAKPGVADKVLITKDYTGDPSTTQWTDITGTLTEGTDWTTFSSFTTGIPAEFLGQGKVVVALYYACEDNSATWEVKNFKVKEGDSGSEENPGGGEVSGNTISVDASSFGLENASDLTTLNLSDGTTLTFDAGGAKNGPKYYTTGTAFRMYPQNTLKITSSAKQIVSVKLICDEYNGQIYNASGDIKATPGKVNVDGVNVTVSGISSLATTLANISATTGAPSQIRIKTLQITYAE